jgi:hypothetical protein
LRFACKSCKQILLSLTSLQFHNRDFLLTGISGTRDIKSILDLSSHNRALNLSRSLKTLPNPSAGGGIWTHEPLRDSRLRAG